MEEFNKYIKTLTKEEQTLLKDFFTSFDEHCLLNKKNKEKLRDDFEKAILYYHKKGTNLKKTLSYLDTKNLGGFYARPPVLWFPLDDAAKIYPLSMAHDRMAIFRLSVYLKENIVPEILKMSLKFSIKRFDSFSKTKILDGFKS